MQAVAAGRGVHVHPLNPDGDPSKTVTVTRGDMESESAFLTRVDAAVNVVLGHEV